MDKNFMSLLGARIADAGYSVVPIAESQKFPGEFSSGAWRPLKGWNTHAWAKTSQALVDAWATFPGCGVGICCGGQSRIIGVDIDILDPEVAGAVRRKFEEILGPTPLVRLGQPPKMLLVYRTAEPMKKITLTPIEVLGEGNQFVAAGLHPKTGKPYRWLDETPAETPVEGVPLVTPDQVHAACAAAMELVPPELRPARAATNAGAHIRGDTALATIEGIREVLAFLPNPDFDWHTYKKVVMATYAASNGSEKAYFALLAWSRKSGKNNDETTRKEWNSCKASPPHSVGFGTLHYLATEAGWVPRSDLAFNVEKDVSDVDISCFDSWPLEQKVSTTTPATGAIAPIKSVEETSTSHLDGAKPPVMAHAEASVSSLEFSHPSAGPAVGAYVSLPQKLIDQFPQEWLYTNSLIGQMAAWVESACPHSHPVFCLMASFTAFGAIVGRQYRVPSGLRPNVACIIIAGTGSGKEGPRNAITRLLLAAGAEIYIGPRGGFSSGSGVVEGLRNQPNMWLAVDEFGKKIAAYGGGKADQNQREMVAQFLEALVNDHVGGKGYANSAENPVKNIRVPNLNIFGSSQIEEMTGALSSAAAADGLIQRFLFVPTFAEYVPMKRGFVQPEVPQRLTDSIKWLMNHCEHMGGIFSLNGDPTSEPAQQIVEVTHQAEDLFACLDQRRVDMARQGRVMWVRSGAMAMKVATLEAIARDPVNPVIDAELLDSARKLVDWFTLYAETHLRTRIADNYDEQNLIKVRRCIQDAGPEGINRTDLLRKNQSVVAAKLNEILARLKESEEITILEVKSTHGPAGKVYVAKS